MQITKILSAMMLLLVSISTVAATSISDTGVGTVNPTGPLNPSLMYSRPNWHWFNQYEQTANLPSWNPTGCSDVRRAFASSNLKLRGYQIVPRYDKNKHALVCKIAHIEISKAAASSEHPYNLIYVYTTVEQDFKDVK